MRKNKPKETRIKDVIDTAVKLFIENGFEGTSMDAVAKNSGLSKGGLYHHFTSKDEVLLAANKVYFDPIIDFMKQAEENISPLEGLTGFINNYINHWSMHQRELIFNYLSISKILGSISLWHNIAQHAEQMMNFYDTLLNKAVSSGELLPNNTKARAVVLFGALDGIPAYLLLNKGITPKQTARFIESVCIDDLRILKPE